MSAVLSLARPSPADIDALAFLSDPATVQAFTAAAPGIQIREGGFGAAIGTLSQTAPPPVIVVDIGESDDPAAGIAALARLAGQRARILAVGTINDVALYQALRDAGAAEYLVKPVQPASVTSALARLRRDKSSPLVEPAKGPHRLFVCGARGGAGATTAAVNLAWSLSRRDGCRVALIDLDLAFGTIALGLDLEPSHGLREILENPDRVDALFVASAAARLGDRLSVFAAEEALDSRSVAPPSTAPALARLCETLADSSECIIVDLPRGLAMAHPAVLAHADHLLLVAEMNLATARDAARLSALVGEHAPDCRITLLASKSSKKGEIDCATFARGARLPVDHQLPWDEKAAAAAANAGRPIGEAAPGSPLAEAIDALARSLVPPPEDRRPRSLWQRLRGKP